MRRRISLKAQIIIFICSLLFPYILYYWFAMSLIGDGRVVSYMSPEAKRYHDEGDRSTCKNIMHCTLAKVIDGDYLIVKDDKGKQHKVRIFGIDAPELEQTFGQSAKTRLNQLITGRKLTVRYNVLNDDGTIRGYLFDDKGNDIGLSMIRGGYAWHCSYGRKYWHNIYEEAMDQARNSKAGLWNYIPRISPWEYRSGVRTN